MSDLAQLLSAAATQQAANVDIAGAPQLAPQAAPVAAVPVPAPPVPEKKKEACLGCRGIKVRCVLPALADPQARCTRCIRLKMECVYKPRGSRYSRGVGSGSGAPEQSTSRVRLEDLGGQRSFLSSPYCGGTATGSGSQASSERLWPPPSPSTSQLLPRPSSSGTSLDAGSASASRSLGESQASPASLNSNPSPHPAVMQDSSDLSFVEVAEAAEARSATAIRTLPVNSKTLQTYPDPFSLFVLSRLEGEQLFEHFHNSLNPYIVCLDRKLHTLDYVLSTSTILLTAVLAVTAKFFRPDIYPALLGHANQLSSRAWADGTSDLGFIQALLCLVYWKEPTDRTSWMRVGFAVRLGYQLRLHLPRTGPIPSDELLAREMLDRERTYLLLVCFDHCYRLHGDSDRSGQTGMTSISDVDAYRWIEDWRGLLAEDDTQFCFSIEICKSFQFIRHMESRSTVDKALCRHGWGMLEATRRRFIDPSGTMQQTLSTQGVQKIRFHYFSELVLLATMDLSRNIQDDLLLGIFLSHTSDLVTDIEASTAVLLFVQDHAAALLFTLGEFLHRLFRIVSRDNQGTLASWMSRIYVACNTAAAGRQSSVPAIIARFYRSVMQLIAITHSLPPTRACSPRRDAEHQADQERPHELDHLAHNLFPDLEGDWSLQGMAHTADAEYWETVFPGIDETSWAWLDPSQALPVAAEGVSQSWAGL